MESSSDPARRAARVYFAQRFFLAMPAWVVVAVYLVRTAKLDPLQLVLMGTVMEAAVFAFEIPTGVVADLVSRKLSVGIGWIVQGVAWALAGATTSFTVILVAWVVWGIGATFESGAYQAWVTDEVGAENVGPVFVRGAQAAYVGGVIGLVGSVAIATVSIRAAIFAAGAVTFAVGLAALVVMPETGFVPAPRGERTRRRAMADTALGGARLIRAAPVLLLLVFAGFFAGAASEGIDRLSEAHLIRDIGVPGFAGADPLWWFAVLGLGSMAIGFVCANLLLRHLRGGGPSRMARALVVFTALELAAVLGFALAGSFALGIGAWWAINAARSLVGPTYNTWLNQSIEDSSVRATVNSLANQADSLGEAGGGPLVGVIGKLISLPAALVASALLLSPALALYRRALRHGGVEPELEELPQAVQAGA